MYSSTHGLLCERHLQNALLDQHHFRHVSLKLDQKVQFYLFIQYIRGGFKKSEEKCCQIVSFHGKFTISMHVVHKHIVNICTKFE